MKVKIYGLFLLGLIGSCTIKKSVILATDGAKPMSDSSLIRLGISEKKQVYILPKALYKKAIRRQLLGKISQLCEDVQKQYREGKIKETKYNQFANEAKYTLQTAIYMMENEQYSETNEDLVSNYLKQGIKTLNKLLN